MSWWGKVIGGAFGFMLGGPLGALLGAALGHNFDRGMANIQIGSDKYGASNTEWVQSAFFTATFSVMGHVAKADGRVSEEEIEMARQIMTHMQLSVEQKRAAMTLFNEGKQSGFNVNAVLDQFKLECHRRRNLLQMFMEIQIATVFADGLLNHAERDLLIHIGDRLGFSLYHIERLISMVQAQQHYSYQQGGFGTQAKPASLDDAYAVLGVSKQSSDGEVKKAYRRLMNQHHPDKLVAKGLPEEMMKIATEKTQEIKKAYEQIKQARGIG